MWTSQMRQQVQCRVVVLLSFFLSTFFFMGAWSLVGGGGGLHVFILSRSSTLRGRRLGWCVSCVTALHCFGVGGVCNGPFIEST